VQFIKVNTLCESQVTLISAPDKELPLNKHRLKDVVVSSESMRNPAMLF
jgi:hypothetical protein